MCIRVNSGHLHGVGLHIDANIPYFFETICLKLLKCVKICVYDDMITKTMSIHNVDIELADVLGGDPSSLTFLMGQNRVYNHGDVTGPGCTPLRDFRGL